MTISKTALLVSSLFSATLLSSTLATADTASIAKSTNVKAAIINECKTQITKKGDLTATEASKYCTCDTDIKGKITMAQQWELQSTINAKKSPSTLGFIQKQNTDMKNCLGPQLTSKIQTLSEAAMKEAQAAQAGK